MGRPKRGQTTSPQSASPTFQSPPTSPQQQPPNIQQQHPNIQQQLTDFMRTVQHRFDKLEGLLKSVTEENKQLKAVLVDRDKEIFRLRDRCNDLEQYQRGWSVRVLNMDGLTEEDQTRPLKVMQHVYAHLFLPILEGALSEGEIQAIPSCQDMLETAHILPAKPGKPHPIICRFYSRNTRALMFRLKKKYAPKMPRQQNQQFARYRYLFFEDLTRATFYKMRALSQEEAVEACWSVNGQVRFRLRDDRTIYKVQNVFEPVRTILNNIRGTEDEDEDKEEEEVAG